MDGVRRSKTIDFSNLNGYNQKGNPMENGRENFRKQRSFSLGNGVPDYSSCGMQRIVEEDEKKCVTVDGRYYARPAQATYGEPVERQRRTSDPSMSNDTRSSPTSSPYGSKNSIDNEPENISVQTPRGKYIIMRSVSDSKAVPDRTLIRNRRISPMSLFFMPLNGALSGSCDVELLREPQRERPCLYRQSSLEEPVPVDTGTNTNEYVYLRGYNQNSILSSSNSSNGSSTKVLKQNGYYSDSSEDVLGSSQGSTTSDGATNTTSDGGYNANSVTHEPRCQRLVDNLGLAATPRRNGTKMDCYSSDEDEDDYGFLSHNAFASNSYPSAMHKAKSPSATRRILPKKWRTKTKLLKSVWSPEVSFLYLKLL
jgi:hypothetical protein